MAGLSAEREKQAAEEAAAAAAAKVAHLTFPHFNATDTAAEVSQSVRLTNAIIEITEALHKKAKNGVRRYPTDDNPDHRLFAVELAGEVLGQVVADLTAMGPKLAAFLLADTSAVVAAKVLGALDAPTFVLVSRELGAMKEKLRGQFAVDEAAQLALNTAFDKIALEESHPRPAERMPLFVRGPAQGVLDQVLKAHGVRATVCFIPEGCRTWRASAWRGTPRRAPWSRRTWRSCRRWPSSPRRSSPARSRARTPATPPGSTRSWRGRGS